MRICDGHALEPVPAWRNYHEFLARAKQNPGPVAALVDHCPTPIVSDYLTSSASRQAAAIMLTELPARLNAALGALLEAERDADAHRVECQLTARAPHVDGLGEGLRLVQPVGFLAVEEEFARVWRGNDESSLSEVSPFPLALTMIEVMRPRCFVYFVPFEGTGENAAKDVRRAVGQAFFRTVADLPGVTPAR